MSAFARPSVVAIVFALALSLAAFVPFVIAQYRREGRLTVRAIIVSFAVLLYVIALASYTLVPLPSNSAFCSSGGVHPQFNPAQVGIDTVAAGIGGASAILHNAALRQFLLNVALFVPLGIFGRRLFGRGILVTALIGLGVSLLIETTQLTGDWFLYPCAYREFDVDDLLANTLGAIAGALVAPAFRFIAVRPGTQRESARPVTAARRLIGMVCDVLFIVILGGALGALLAITLFAAHLRPASVPGFVSFVVVTVAPVLVELVLVLATGRTIGEFAVRLKPLARPSVGFGLLRWLLGIGGFGLAANFGNGFAVLAPILAIVSFILLLTTRNHRGFAYLASRLDVGDDRAK